MFASLPPDRVIAAGGGFLSLHGDLLEGTHAVLVPVTFETYRERLLEDRTRPRLRPEVPLEEELRGIFDEREAAPRAPAHAAAGGLPRRDLGWESDVTALVVTLPPGLERLDAERFAARAEEAGASFLELRTDLSGVGAELVGLLPLLVAERGVALPEAWLARAAIVDRELPASGPVGPRKAARLAPQPHPALSRPGGRALDLGGAAREGADQARRAARRSVHRHAAARDPATARRALRSRAGDGARDRRPGAPVPRAARGEQRARVRRGRVELGGGARTAAARGRRAGAGRAPREGRSAHPEARHPRRADLGLAVSADPPAAVRSNRPARGRADLASCSPRSTRTTAASR